MKVKVCFLNIHKWSGNKLLKFKFISRRIKIIKKVIAKPSKVNRKISQIRFQVFKRGKAQKENPAKKKKSEKCAKNFSNHFSILPSPFAVWGVLWCKLRINIYNWKWVLMDNSQFFFNWSKSSISRPSLNNDDEEKMMARINCE